MSLALAVSCTKGDPLTYVDPYIGSAGHGHVFVGASVPFGAIQAGPQNIFQGWDWCSGYHYSDSVLIGFSHTHLSGTGCKDLGDIIVMPFITESRYSQQMLQDVSVRYSHSDETVTPYLYEIRMKNGIDAQITASTHVAGHRYRFPASTQKGILIDPYDGNGFNSRRSLIRKRDSCTVTGFRTVKGWAPEVRTVYYAIRTDLPFERLDIYENDCLSGIDSLAGVNVKAVLRFTGEAEKVKMKVSISSVSESNAMENIDAELSDWNFAKVAESSKRMWRDELSKVRIESRDEEAKRIFYTSMYHTMIAPSQYSDVNGEFMGIDGKVHKKDDGSRNYTTFSCWDTYRALHPWFTIVQQDRSSEIINSMLSIYDQQGKLPIWPLFNGETNTMPGYGSVPIVCDAVLKGIRGIDRRRALSAAVNTANNRNMPGISYLLDNGYIPADCEVKATSKALEYAIADWGIASLAKSLNYSDIEAAFAARAGKWRDYYDAGIDFIRPKLRDGSWADPYDPCESIHGSAGWFAEGTGWQYTFLVPQDPYGLIDAMGGDEAFCTRLDSLFLASGEMGDESSMDISGLIGQYAHGNEPSHHIVYLYNYCGKQWRTAEKVRDILDRFYSDAPDGIIGNEDCGQMSAWFILSSLGLYQVNPSCGQFSFGSPIYDRAEIKMDNGRKFVIVTENNGPDNIYIQSVRLNGHNYDKSYIEYEDIVKGCTLTFVMGPEPNVDFGSSKENRPDNSI